MEFNNLFKKKISEVEEICYSFLPKEEGYQKILFDAMNYSVKAGGKRLRPMLIMETYNICGGNGDIIKPFMSAMEMLHTYSLVHDDLPAMDNDELRRGKKTTWCEYGEAIGILAGDGLLNYSFETAIKAYGLTGNIVEKENIIKALEIFMNKAGVYGMIGGQTVDVMNDNKPIDSDTLNFIFRLKTGALIEASMMIGAILAGADDETINAFEKIGHYVGMAFQIQDDILDVTSTTDKLGKPINSDEKNNKVTYITLYGIEKAASYVSQYTNDALAVISNLEEQNKIVNTDFFKSLLLMLVNRDK